MQEQLDTFRQKAEEASETENVEYLYRLSIELLSIIENHVGALEHEQGMRRMIQFAEGSRPGDTS